MRNAIAVLEHWTTHTGLVISGCSIVIMMLAEVINAFGRKLLAPLPNTLQIAESMMITTVLMGIGYVALINEHTNVTIMTRNWKPSVNRFLDGFSNFFGCVVFTILAWGAWRLAYKSYLKLEMVIGVFRFPVWPFKFLFAIGLSLFVLQLFLNTIKFFGNLVPKTIDKKT